MASEQNESTTYDVVIVGTGLYGIQAARYYLDVHQDAKLVLLESDDVVGGTWSSKDYVQSHSVGPPGHISLEDRLFTDERIYEGFWTQTPVKMAEFSDRPMSPPPAEDQYYGFFNAKYTTSYLESYVDSHKYAGRTIRDRILFNARVKMVDRYQPSEVAPDIASSKLNWTITYNESEKFHASKFIEATGMTSQPRIPSLPGSSEFRGKALHHKSFGQEETSLLKDSSVQNICILGGAKSAADTAYAFAKASDGKKRSVHWIIREDGNGPCAFFPVQPSSPRYANSNEGFYNRYMASSLPNWFGNRWGLFKWLLQSTMVGRWYVQRLWDKFDKGLRGLINYQREDGKEMGFPNMEPDTPIFWQNDSSGVANRPDFLSTLATKVNVYRRNISHLSAESITLTPKGRSKFGEEAKPLTIPIDTLICCTGWSASTTLFQAEQASKFGLRVSLDVIDPKTQSHWNGLEKAADSVVLSRFPTLRHPPDYHKIEPTETPFRLYKAMAPPMDVCSTHSIVFLGRMVVGNNFFASEAQAMWAVAYLDGRIQNLPSSALIEIEVAETVAWDRRRYLNKGELGSWFYFDVVDYSDALLEQVGLNSHRKGRGWMRDLMDPCFASDLKGIVEEYKSKYET